MIQTHTEATNNRLCDPYQELALAIVRQAADDYRSLARRIEATGNEMDQRYLSEKMKSISRFFLSDWFRMLSNSDKGAEILERLDREVFGLANVGVMADTIAMIVDLQKEIDQQAAIIIHQKRELFLLLDQIDPDYATLLSEHYLDGKSFVEIGKIHGYERRWAKRRMSKAVAQLQEILDQQFVNETMPISSGQDNH